MGYNRARGRSRKENMVKYSLVKLAVSIYVFAILAFPAVAAGRVEVPTLPPSLFADSEVSTNVVVNRTRNDVKVFDVSLDLAASVSNSVQIAFGRDADGDGDLAPGETALVVGWRTRRWFVEDVRRGVRHFEPASDASGPRFLRMSVRTDDSFAPERAAFTNETGACFAVLSRPAPAFLFDRSWNLAKVTRRGVAPPGEWCCIDNDYRKFYLILR